MKTIIQVPCLNEEATIGRVIADIRAATAGLPDVGILIVDDGCTDRTVEVARAAGADYIARHATNQGLARAFMTGLSAALNLGADVIVNTDADNQYKASGIPALIAPVAEGRADVVVGARPIDETEHFSPIKKRLQRLGSHVARRLSGTSVKDATSGFRALSFEAAIRLHTYSDYTYTLETLIQAGRSGLRVVSVDIETNPPTRASRLFRSMWRYVLRSASDMLRVHAIYAPLRAYLAVAVVPLGLSLLLGLRYVALVSFVDPTRSHAPSLILAGILAGLGFMIAGLGLIGESLSVNRRILEELRTRQRRQDAAEGKLRGRADFTLETVKRPA
jgi:glycosyltransferase involved in cell wall biosynthesis